MNYRLKYKQLLPLLSERDRRLVLAADAAVLGHGGVTLIAELSAVSRPTIIAGKRDLIAKTPAPPPDHIRRAGAGRHKATENQPELQQTLIEMMEPVTRGHPESVLMWTCISTRNLAASLKAKGFSVSHNLVSRLLAQMGFSLQANSKRLEASSAHIDRNAQFQYIHDTAQSFIEAGKPVISVDTKKKELLGNHLNNGQEYRVRKDARPVDVHDFGKLRAAPYGIYDLARNEGFVNIGTSYDTGQFAVNSIEQWWQFMGHQQYSQSKELLITADGGGSNGHRVRLWKTSLQAFADASGLRITVCHFPPGTSKWNKIEHRMFSHISLNWKGIPLTDIETMIELISAATNKRGLKIHAREERREYTPGIKVSDQELENLSIARHTFHPDWNYTICPKT